MDLILKILEGEMVILRLPVGLSIPDWLDFSSKPLVSLTQTTDEISLVCPANIVPAPSQPPARWRALRVLGTLDFSAVGVLAGILRPLAEAGISILSISTFDTDYILVPTASLASATKALRKHFAVQE